MADEWAAFNPQQQSEPDPWKDFAPEPAPAAARAPAPAEPTFDTMMEPGAGDPDVKRLVHGIFGHIGDTARAAGEGFTEGFGDAPLGMSGHDIERMQELGMFRKGQNEGLNGVFRAMNELVYFQGAKAIDAAVRTTSGLFRGAQGAVSAGLGGGTFGRDIAAVPEAFFGSPHPLGVPKTLPKPFVKPEPMGPIEGSPNPGLPRVEAARTGIPEVDAVLGSPVTREAIENPVIDRSHDVPYMAGGSVPLDDPTVYIDRHVPREQTVKRASDPTQTVTFDPADPWVVHENVEQHTMEMLIKGGMTDAEAYRVAHFEYAEKAEQAWYRAHDIDQVAAEAEQASWLPKIQHENPENPPPNLYEKPYPHDHVAGARHEAVSEAPPTPEEVSRARDIIAKHADEIAGPKPIDVGQARDLGVVGPPREPITEGTPAEAAARTVAASRTGDDVLRGPEPGGGNPWRERFEQFVGKIKTDEDAKQLIRDAADANDEFMPARQGEIPLRQVEDLAGAAGIAPELVDRTGVGRLLQNDNQVRNAMQAMLAATEQVKAAAREVKLDGSQANLMKLQEAMLRRDTWVEQVVGHRAEWGRTGNVFQEFLQRVKDEETFTQFMKDQDRSPEGLRKIADAVDALDGAQAAKFLSDANKPTFFDKAMWYWVNALISGPVTHAKYVIANAAFGIYESAVVTPIAGVQGAVRRTLGGTRDSVYVGEGAARLWGIVAGTPDAIVAAAKAARTGLQTPLPGELAQGIVPKNNQNIAFQQRPIPGTFGAIIGLPSRGASAIHSFFNFLGYRASVEAQAYRAAAKDGLHPLEEPFWQRRAAAADNPTPEMMNIANEEGYRLTYITELGPVGKAVSNAIRVTKVGRLVLPFTHIPFNILARGIEGTPAAFLSADARADLFGKNGAVKQDMATARLIAGGAVGAWGMNLVLNDRMTGFGPTDPKERAQWLATGHQPYSIRIGDYWYSFNRFGSLGTMLGLYANLAEAIPHMKPDAEELTKAVAMTVHSTGRLLEDEVGMQGLAGLIEAINEPERKGTRFVSNFAGSWLPFSSALRQTASATDPYMRETKSVVDGLRAYIPTTRQNLQLKRNWLGEPIANAGFGGDLPVPGVSAIIQHRAATPDPLALEMKTLDLHPAPPQDRIGGVKLTPQLYDEYQTTAGLFTRSTLEQVVAAPDWLNMPRFARAETFQRMIASTRQTAAAMMQAKYPDLIKAGVQQRMDYITGASTTPRPKHAPASLSSP